MCVRCNNLFANRLKQFMCQSNGQNYMCYWKYSPYSRIDLYVELKQMERVALIAKAYGGHFQHKDQFGNWINELKKPLS